MKLVGRERLEREEEVARRMSSGGETDEGIVWVIRAVAARKCVWVRRHGDSASRSPVAGTEAQGEAEACDGGVQWSGGE